MVAMALWSRHMAGDLRLGRSNLGRGLAPTSLGTFDPRLPQKCTKNEIKIISRSSQDIKVSDIIQFARHSSKKIIIMIITGIFCAGKNAKPSGVALPPLILINNTF